MNYLSVIPARFVARPNRFIANCILEDGSHVTAHVKNTGRCKELLVPGASVYLEPSTNPARKTAFSLLAVYKEERLINMDAQAPNRVVVEALRDGRIELAGFPRRFDIFPETTRGDSRFDFCLKAKQQQAFIEVKGVTLEKEGVVMFPDAPTERGVKHIQGLIKAVEEGCKSYLIFVVQMEHVLYFVPNNATHPQFGEKLREAAAKGVTVLAYDCTVTPSQLRLNQPVQVIF